MPSRSELAPHCADVCLWRAGLSVQHCKTIEYCPGTAEVSDYDLGEGRVGFAQNCPNQTRDGDKPELHLRMDGEDSVVFPGSQLPPADELRRQIKELYKRFE